MTISSNRTPQWRDFAHTVDVLAASALAKDEAGADSTGGSDKWRDFVHTVDVLTASALAKDELEADSMGGLDRWREFVHTVDVLAASALAKDELAGAPSTWSAAASAKHDLIRTPAPRGTSGSRSELAAVRRSRFSKGALGGVSLAAVLALFIIPPALWYTHSSSPSGKNATTGRTSTAAPPSFPGAVSLTRDALNDIVIADSTEAIRLDPKDARPFNKRGLAYLDKADDDRAIADFSEAIRLDPKDAQPFNNRGLAYLDKAEYDHAIADFTEAIRLDPNYTGAFQSRGHAKFYVADYGAAAADLSHAVRQQPQDAYSVLWRYLASARASMLFAILNSDSYCLPGYLQLAETESYIRCEFVEARQLELNATKLKQTDWPYPIVELFIGRRTPEATLTAAEPNHRCEAQFYTGEWYLLHGNRTAAMSALKTAADNCPKAFVEYAGARAELKRLEYQQQRQDAPRLQQVDPLIGGRELQTGTEDEKKRLADLKQALREQQEVLRKPQAGQPGSPTAQAGTQGLIGDTIEAICVLYCGDPNMSGHSAASAEPPLTSTGVPTFLWPLRGRLIANFGSSRNGAVNEGIDLAAPIGTAVRAADAGVVAYAGNGSQRFGSLVVVRHTNGYVTAYAHASELLVGPGDTVRRGQLIAKSGKSGRVTKPQLHFEIRKGSVPVDPSEYLVPN
jgi:murein DD-endopeptidase MepM/ murein hydrolase activator NlpD